MNWLERVVAIVAVCSGMLFNVRRTCGLRRVEGSVSTPCITSVKRAEIKLTCITFYWPSPR